MNWLICSIYVCIFFKLQDDASERRQRNRRQRSSISFTSSDSDSSMSSSESISGAESISEDSLPSSPRQLAKSRKEVDLEVRLKIIFGNFI